MSDRLDLDAIAAAAQAVANVHSETKAGGGPPSSYCGTCSGDYLMAWPCDAAAQAAETLALVGVLGEFLPWLRGESVLQQVRALHREATNVREPHGCCVHCQSTWPCPTIRIIEGEQ